MGNKFLAGIHGSVFGLGELLLGVSGDTRLRPTEPGRTGVCLPPVLPVVAQGSERRHQRGFLLIEEQEVPRVGIHVERRFNYAGTADGRAWLWCGRRKRVGPGEASSGLRFDIGVKPGQR